MTKLTREFPVFNDDVEEKFEIENPQSAELEDFEQYIIGEDICSIYKTKRILRKEERRILYLSKIQLFPCKCGELKKVQCQMVEDMVRVMQRVESAFRSRMEMLDPNFILVGSIAEGTRAFSANELDITIQYKVSTFVRE